MLKRLSLTALAAAFVLTTAALTPASAGHGGGHGFHGARFGHARFFGNRFAHSHFHPHHRWDWRWRHGSYGYRVGPAYYGTTYGVATPVASCPTNCLAKEYLPNGAVVFTDRCTNESAVGQPNG